MAQVPEDLCYSKVHILPDEILLEIFKVASRSPPPDFTPPYPLVISSVCSRWRRLAITYPLLWTNVCIPSHLAYYNDLFLERSLPAEIDVTLDITQNGAMFYHGPYHHISHLLKTNVDRLKSLTIRTETLDDVQKFTEDLQGVTAPVLGNMEIVVRFDDEADTQSDTPGCPILKDAPHLRSLRIHGIPLECSPPIVHLTHLDIGKFYPTLDAFRNLVDSCPSLTSLVLRQFGNASSGTSGGESMIIEAPNLHSLAISFDFSHPDERCTCPIHYLAAANLKYLEISAPFGPSLDLLAHMRNIIKSWPDKSSRVVRLSDVTLSNCLPLLDAIPHESTAIELTKVTEEALPQVLSMPNFKKITLDLYSVPTSAWCNIFPPIVAVSSSVLLHAPPLCSDPHLLKAITIHGNMSMTSALCDEGMIQEENLENVESDDELDLYNDADSDAEYDFDFDFEYEYDYDYDGYYEDGFVEDEDYEDEEFEGNERSGFLF